MVNLIFTVGDYYSHFSKRQIVLGHGAEQELTVWLSSEEAILFCALSCARITSFLTVLF